MLEPESRLLLLDALRPPPGYSFDRAVGTTFTLDLTALLITPVAFALFDVETEDGRIAANPIAVLESVRRFADRITVFTQAGQIKVPPAFRSAYAYLERSVVPVSARRRGAIFHPKVWVIRFTDKSDVRYRFLCLSRNLTFDRSWDTVLRLDGAPTKSLQPISRPLARFLRALPTLAVDRSVDEHTPIVRSIADEVATVEWEPLPDGLQLQQMWPMGLDARPTWPFPTNSWDRLIVSPFVESGFLERYRGNRNDGMLVSRPESLDALGAKGLPGIARTLVLQTDAEAEVLGLETEAQPTVVGEEGGLEAELRGLHAKLYVIDNAWWSQIWTGSANATAAAFNGNVEFMVELRGRNTTHGAKALINPPAGPTVGFGRMVTDYVVSAEPIPRTAEEEGLVNLDGLALRLGAFRFRAQATTIDVDRFQLTLEGTGELPKNRAKGVAPAIAVRPLSLGASAEVEPETAGGGLHASWEVSFTALTAFFVFDLSVTVAGREVRASFIVRAELEGAPENRLERVLAGELKSRSDLVRLLLMLLGRSDSAFGDLVDIILGELATKSDRRDPVLGSEALLEPLMHTLARDPDRLDEIDRLVTQLATSEEGRALLPDGWRELWLAVKEARPRPANGKAA